MPLLSVKSVSACFESRQSRQPLLPRQYFISSVYSQQSSLVLQLRGLPPAWTHCLENSDTVLHRQKGSACSFVPLPQWQRSATQAEVKEATSSRLWQLLKAGPVRICSHRGFYRTHGWMDTQTGIEMEAMQSEQMIRQAKQRKCNILNMSTLVL